MNIRCVCALLVTHLALDSMRKDCHICVRVFTLFSLHCIVLLCLLTSDQARCSADILSVHPPSYVMFVLSLTEKYDSAEGRSWLETSWY